MMTTRPSGRLGSLRQTAAMMPLLYRLDLISSACVGASQRGVRDSYFGALPDQLVASTVFSEQPFEVCDRMGESLLERRSRYPVQRFLRTGNVGAALTWIVLWKRPVDDTRSRTRHLDDHGCKLKNRELAWVTDVDRASNRIRCLH